MTFATICYSCSITCCSQARCPQLGGKPYSKCCQKHWSLEQQRTSDQLWAFVCFIKSLHIWFWVELRIHWKQASRRNNMDSTQKDVLKNTYWLSTWSWTKPWRWTSHCGSSALIFQKPSTGSIGNHSGKRWAIMAYHNTWFGSSKCFIINNVGQLLDQWKTALNLTLQLACDKGVFSAHVCFVPSLSGHCPNGGHNLMVLATIFKTEGFRYWICALLMISLFL